MTNICMKKKLVLVLGILFLVAVGQCWAQETTNPGVVGISINPLGFLEFGPSIDLEVRPIAALAIVGRVRPHGLGLISHVIAWGYDENLGILESWAFGGGFRFFFMGPQAPNSFYLGLIAEYGIEKQTGTSYSYGDYVSNSKYIDVQVNAGYRWHFGHVYIGLGASIGAMAVISSQVQYVNPSYAYRNHQGDMPISAIGMVDLTVGVTF